jgi:hypothetical protein
MHMCNIAHEDGAAIHLFDGKGIDGVDEIRRVVHRQGVILVADFDIARGKDDILALQRRADIRGGQSACLQGLGIQIRHDDARLAAVRVGDFCAMYHRQGGADDVLTQVVELGIR